MSDYSIILYDSAYKNTWNQFIKSAKNSSFLFYRDFMEYHKDRFDDYSLMLYKNDKLQAVLPGTISKNILNSHQGLTYGGLVLAEKIKFREVFALFRQLLIYLEKQRIETLVIKDLPSFYCAYPSEELDYLYFLLDAKNIQTDLATVIDLKNPLPIQKNRLEGVKKAEKQGLKIEKVTDFTSFWEEILIPNLQQKHHTQPVHSLEEISLLQQRFPNHIHQFNVLDTANRIVAGATIFETAQVAHVQYISANADKQQLGSLDFLFHRLIESAFKDKNYFDFGTSNEQAGSKLNAGLQYWKEGFGARSLVYRRFQIATHKHKKLENVML